MIRAETITERYAAFTARLAHVAQRAGRDPQSISVLAVTKGRSVEEIRSVISAGAGAIGENYVQEARSKFGSLPPVARHFIGHVQTNKAAEIVRLFDVVETVDRLSAAQALAKASSRARKTLRVLLQINISQRERFGCAPEKAVELAHQLRQLDGIELDGVMAIGPLDASEPEIARAFESAAQVRKAVGGGVLSIGMSDDWEAAVRAGSTQIRIGTALFGPRPTARTSKG